MHMPYTSNPRMPQVRMEAVRLVKYQRWSTRQAARHTGYSQAAIVQWCKRDPTGGWSPIETRSSKPNSHPKQLPPILIHRILTMRLERNQCAEILHQRLIKEGWHLSLSSVKRVLKKHGVSRFSRWKKWHQYPPRPLPEKPGFLIQIDSVHEGPPDNRVSAYALIDVCSRWAFAEPVERVNSRNSVFFLKKAKQAAPFQFKTIQSDHGQEFSKWFTKVVEHHGISHRHSRVRRPTDNAHVERFIQTLQRECLHRIPRIFTRWQKEIPEFIRYYNTERIHMSLNFKTPTEVITSY